MKTLNKINIKKIRNYALTAITGILIGWLFFHSSENKTAPETTHQHEMHEDKPTIWTCSMHPQIRSEKPGKCPICSMDLIPLTAELESENATDPNEIAMSESALKLAEIETQEVQEGIPEKEVYLNGKIAADERNIAELTARFAGRIEKLYVNFTGQQVQKGEKLATIYSPELLSAQKELIEASKYKESNPSFYQAAKNKLLLWDLSEKQIKEIETSGEPQTYVDIQSPIAGTVTKRQIALGNYVKEGMPLFQIINLNPVWALFDAYETDLPWLHVGDSLNFTVEALPGKTFHGKVSFIDPVLDAQTRVAAVRVTLNNPGQVLKPAMFASGMVKARFNGNKKSLLVPKSAVLWTGKRSLVYIKVPDRKQSTFINREITLGPDAGNYFVVTEGLNPGEEIAVNGVFKIDAAAQLAGKTSMMNPDGGSGSTGNMPGMDMGNQQATKTKTNGKNISNAFFQQLTRIYQAYLPLKNALVASDAKKASQQANQMLTELARVKMEWFQGDAHHEWMNMKDSLNNPLQIMVNTPEIEKQREAFVSLNQVFYHMIKKYGLVATKTYYQFCPMANQSKGAFWFSDKPNIENPYYGDAMLECGDVSETLNFK